MAIEWSGLSSGAALARMLRDHQDTTPRALRSRALT